MNRKYIDRFCRETGFVFNDGEVGFGRACVGIMNPKTECYIAYQVYDENYEVKHVHDVAYGAQPETAYHKGPYLACLHDGSEEGKAKAIADLDLWCEKIMAAHYEVVRYEEKNSITALFNGGTVTQIAISGGCKYDRFLEIF
jgi:hypothetical protein